MRPDPCHEPLLAIIVSDSRLYASIGAAKHDRHYWYVSTAITFEQRSKEEFAGYDEQAANFADLQTFLRDEVGEFSLSCNYLKCLT